MVGPLSSVNFPTNTYDTGEDQGFGLGLTRFFVRYRYLSLVETKDVKSQDLSDRECLQHAPSRDSPSNIPDLINHRHPSFYTLPGVTTVLDRMSVLDNSPYTPSQSQKNPRTTYEFTLTDHLSTLTLNLSGN